MLRLEERMIQGVFSALVGNRKDVKYFGLFRDDLLVGNKWR